MVVQSCEGAAELMVVQSCEGQHGDDHVRGQLMVVVQSCEGAADGGSIM